MRWTELILGLVGLWIALAPEGWGWRSFADAAGEERLLRFFLGFTVILVAGLIHEKNRMRGHMLDLVDALNRMLYGKDYAKHREAVDLLIRAASGGNPDVAKKAFDSLRTLTGQVFGDDVTAWRTWWDANRGTFTLSRDGDETKRGRRRRGG